MFRSFDQPIVEISEYQIADSSTRQLPNNTVKV